MDNHAKELAVLSTVNKTLHGIVNTHYQKIILYQRIEDCIRRFVGIIENKTANSMAWFFHIVHQDINKTLFIQKQTPKNKCKYKSMFVFNQHVHEEHANLGSILYSVESHMQCVDECLDCIKKELLPHIQHMRFVFGCNYKRRARRKEFDELTLEFMGLLRKYVQMAADNP
jgi:hypothetical protein